MTKAKINVGRGGRDGRVILDGMDISTYVTSLTLRADARSLALLVLDLIPHEIEVEGEVSVVIQPELWEALIRLGWKPPEVTE